jgi:hypothetical protein
MAMPEMTFEMSDQLRDKKLISFFCCGVQKGGTTSLDFYMCAHPELAPSKDRKEVSFFNDETFDWNNPDYSIIDTFYSPNHGDRIRFDITPDYSWWPQSIERIAAYNPNAKLIYLFRDPFERAWSQWCMVYAKNKETLLFQDAIRSGRKRLDKLTPIAKKRRIYTYVERGLYANQVRRALANFPRENLLFLRTEDFSADHVGTLDQIAKFLGISPFPAAKLVRKNHRPLATADFRPTNEDRTFFYDLVHEDVLEFAKLSGIDVSKWPCVTRELKGG